MSGGVDSSVAAALLVRDGYQVIGVMLRLWSEPGRGEENRCCSPDSMVLARRVAALLGIPFYTIDAQEAFRETVVKSFIEGYSSGITPNPCLTCNREIRWGFLLDRAQALGAQFLATGHYARLKKDAQGKVSLYKSIDLTKDQSYVLHLLNQASLTRTMLPLGDYTKSQVREIARELGLPVAERSDSQDLCFLGGDDYAPFLLRNDPSIERPGPILSSNGKEIGQHRGLAFYTIGQRKGIGISSPSALYVIDKDISRNTLIVGPKESLGVVSLFASAVNWIGGTPPVKPFKATVKIRYRAPAVPALVEPLSDSKVKIAFDQPMIDITPGQAAVIYLDDQCLGGGIIQYQS